MIEVVKRYLKENIDETVALRAWDARRLPIFLRATYDFHEVSLLGCEFLLLSFLREIPRVSEIKNTRPLCETIAISRLCFVTGK